VKEYLTIIFQEQTPIITEHEDVHEAFVHANKWGQNWSDVYVCKVLNSLNEVGKDISVECCNTIGKS
jgi:hypothetical protein